MFTARPAAPAATLLALRERIDYCDVDVAAVIDGAVTTHRLVDLDDAYLTVEDADTGRRIDVLPADVETVEATCTDCGGDYDSPGDPTDCAVAFDGHVRPECPGCGDEITADTAPSAHRRCHLIP